MNLSRLRSAVFVCLIICGFTSWAQTRMISHLTRATGGFTSTVFIENQSVSSEDFVLTPYTEAGVSLTQVTGTLPGGAVAAYGVDELFIEGTNVSHFTIEGNRIHATVAYRAATGPGTPAHVSESNIQATRTRLYAGDWSEIFDGLAVVNTGDEATDVWVTQKHFSGTILSSIKIVSDLAPMAKGLYVLGGPDGSEFESQTGTYFEVYANQKLAVTALRGTVPSADVGYLWTNDTQILGLAESTRDAQGVWFITGGTLYDVYEMMGYNVATDRLWQAEIYRRAARGRLAELFGPDYVSQDMEVRTTGYSNEELLQGFEDLDDESKTVVKAYVDGFNRHIGEVRSDPNLLPLEFLAVIAPTIEFWTTSDALAWVALLQRQFDPMDFGMGELANAALLEELMANFPATAVEMFEDLRFSNDPDAPTMIPSTGDKTLHRALPNGDLANLRPDIDFGDLYRTMRDRRDRHIELLEQINARVKMGSYAWAVSGAKTASGRATLYSGPQMGFETPSITLEGSIRGGGIEVSGMSVPGIPGIIIGRTPHHAWSMQVGHAHTCDVYIEPPSALSGGPHRTETIHVRGAEDVVFDVYRTAHGPVINQNPIVAWKYAHWGHEFDLAKGNLALVRAQSMDEFGAGVARFGVSQHFCYADRDGNIAYWMSGRDPERPLGEFRLPQGSLTTALEYDIDILKPMAHDRNTAQGFYGGWNNKANASYDNAPFGPSHAYGPFHRAHAVQDYLSTHDNLTYEEIRDLAINIAATESFGGGGNPWLFVRNPFMAAVAANSTPERDAAVAMLEAWDGHFVSGGEVRWISGQDRADAWMLMNAWVRNTVGYMLADELDSYSNLLGFNVMLHALGEFTGIQNFYDWFSNAADPEAPQTADEAIIAGLDAALAALGDPPWGTGQRGEIEYWHLLPIFGEPVWTTPFGSRSTYAHCVEFGPNGPTRIESMFPLGESGHIYPSPTGVPEFDPHFFSMTPFFDNFAPREFPLFE